MPYQLLPLAHFPAVPLAHFALIDMNENVCMYLVKVVRQWVFWNECGVGHLEAQAGRETAIYALLVGEWAHGGRCYLVVGEWAHGPALHDLWKVVACHLALLPLQCIPTNQTKPSMSIPLGRQQQNKNSRQIGRLGRSADAWLSEFFFGDNALS